MTTTVRVAALMMTAQGRVVLMMTNRVESDVSMTALAADLMMTSVLAVDSTTTSRVSVVSVMRIDRAADSMMTGVVSKMRSVLVVALMMTDRVAATVVLTTVPVADVLRMKKNLVMAARAMSVRKTRCMIAREQRARFA
jgi:hypothetical protein